MKVIPFKAEHLAQLQIQPGQRDTLSYVTAPAYAKMLEGQFAFTAMVGDEVVAVGGVTELWDNRGLVWSFVDANAGKHFVALHKAVKEVLDFVPYKRLEADTPCEFEAGHRWLRMLGFTMEAPRMRAYRVDGGDSALYAKVR